MTRKDDWPGRAAGNLEGEPVSLPLRASSISWSIDPRGRAWDTTAQLDDREERTNPEAHRGNPRVSGLENHGPVPGFPTPFLPPRHDGSHRE